MRQYKLYIQIIIIIIIIKKDKVKSRRMGDGHRERGGEREILNFFFLVSFLDLRKSDRRFLSEQKAKLDYMTRATRRYQYLSVSSNFKR